MSLGIAGVDFQSLFQILDSLVVLSEGNILARQILIRVQVERIQFHTTPVVRERLLSISEIVEVEAIQNMGAAQVGIQFEGTLKFPRGGGPIPVAVVRDC